MLPGGAASPDVVWAPQPGSQELFLTCPVFECLIEGTRGGGKTDVLLMDFLQHVGVGWGIEWRGILFRQSYPQLKDVIAKSRKWIPLMFPGARFNKADSTWTFPDGEELLFRHMKDPDDYWNYHGHAYPWIGWEELTNWASPDCYKRMMSCCRSTVGLDRRDTLGRPMPRKYRATTNPYGVGHTWVKRRFRLPEWRGRVLEGVRDEEGKLERPRVAIHSRLTENGILMESEPDYLDTLRGSARNEAELKAWIYGDWTITSGGMFDDLYDPKVHVVDDFQLPPTWRVRRALDWGSARPFSAGWWARSDGCDVRTPDGRVRSTVRGDMYRIGELYGTTGGTNEGLRLTAHEVAARLVEKEIELGLRDKRTGAIRRVRQPDGTTAPAVLPGAADAAIFSDDQGESIADRMARPVRLRSGSLAPGVRFRAADKSPGSRKAGWEKLRELLRGASSREMKGLYCFRSCGHWIELFPVLPRDDDDLDDVDSDSEDHIGDETRYEAMRPTRGAKSGTVAGGH